LRLVFDGLAKLRRLVCPTKWLVTSPSPIHLPPTLESLWPRGDARVALDTVIELDVRDATGLQMLHMGDLVGCKWHIGVADERAATADVVDTDDDAAHAVDFRIPSRATPSGDLAESSRRPVSPSVGVLVRSLHSLSLSSGTFAGGMPEFYALATLPALERLLVARLPDRGLADWPSAAEPKPDDKMAGGTMATTTDTKTTPKGAIERPRMQRLQMDLGPHVTQFDDHVSRMLATYPGLRELRLSAWSNTMTIGVCGVVAECAAMKSGVLRYARLPMFDSELFSCPPASERSSPTGEAALREATVQTVTPSSCVSAAPLSLSSSSSPEDNAADLASPSLPSPPLSSSPALEVGTEALYWYTDASGIFAFVPITGVTVANVASIVDDPERVADTAAAATKVRTVPIAHIEVPTKRNAAHARTVHVVVRDGSLAAIMRRGTCVVAFSAASSPAADLWVDRDAPRVGALTCVGGRAPKRAGKLDSDEHEEYRRRGPGAPYACLCEIPRRRWRKQHADATELLSMFWIGGRTTEADVESDDDSDDDDGDGTDDDEDDDE
jgi:hypothetical protein